MFSHHQRGQQQGKKSPQDRELQDLRLSCEDVIEGPASRSEIHENQLSYTHGLAPHQPLMTQLPEMFRVWDEYSHNLPTMLAEATERVMMAKLPLLDASDPALLPDKYLARAATILGNMAHGFYSNQRKSTDHTVDPLPDAIRIPWEQVSARIGRRLPNNPGKLNAARTNYDTFLCNWKIVNPAVKIDGENNGSVKLLDLELLNPALGSRAESSNNLTIVLVELRFAPALKQSIEAVKAVARKDDAALLLALKRLTQIVESVTRAFDTFSPNEHSSTYADQSVWAKSVAKFDGYIPGGHPGLSGSQFPIFHMLDSLIERKAFDTLFGKAIQKAFQVLPRNVAAFISAFRQDIASHSIRKYVEESKNPALISAYGNLQNAYLGEQGLMNVHAVKSYGYLKINFRNGRIMTNGGNGGPSTVDSEPQRKIVFDFKEADKERAGRFIPKPLYAERVSVKKFGESAAEVVIDVSQTSLEFLPGDHCQVLPKNSQATIDMFVQDNKLDPDFLLSLNPVWKRFFMTELGRDVNDIVKLSDILPYVDLRKASQMDVVEIIRLEPVTARQYSVSCLPDQQEGQIRLTVGRCFFENRQFQCEGLASGYLINGQDAINIKKVPARTFKLPVDPQAPILMFCGGTGISPFIGFINSRSTCTQSGLNWLFFGTQDMQSFYYEKELAAYAMKGTVKVSVIFSREADNNTVILDEKSGCYSCEYNPCLKSRHVDALIKAHAWAISDIILRQNGYVYVCGNAGFARTVNRGIQEAIAADEHASGLATAEQSEACVRKLMADHRYCVDEYAVSPECQLPTFYPSDVARHNQLNDCWIIYSMAVYDMTEFVHTHPGGRKIIHVNAGRDATEDFQSIGHHHSQQILARLDTYKKGALVLPAFTNAQCEELYNQALFFLTSVVEMENSLVNNTTYYLKDEGRVPAYLWREVYSVLIDGQLADFALKAGAKGSFKFVFGELLNELFSNVGLPVSDALTELHLQASELGIYIRNASSEPLTDEQYAHIYKVYQSLLSVTFKLLQTIKSEMIEVLSKMENQTDNFDFEEFKSGLEKIAKELALYAWTIKHTHQILGLQAGVKGANLPSITQVCIFANRGESEAVAKVHADIPQHK